MSQIDLEQRSGLPLVFDTEFNRLMFKGCPVSIQPDIRTRYQMSEVLSPHSSVHDTPKEFYQMYRGLGFAEDLELIAEKQVRYDVTVMPSATIGPRGGEPQYGGRLPLEFIKTLGHTHALPEVYEVLNGQAVYLIEDRARGVVEGVRAFEGDKVFIPSNHGHVTINTGTQPLIMANWISTQTTSEYKGYQETKGAMCFLTQNGDGEFQWFANPLFNLNDDNPSPRKRAGIRDKDLLRMRTGVLSKGTPLYTSAKECDFNNLGFLQQVYIKP